MSLTTEARDVYGYGWIERGKDHDMAPYLPHFAYGKYLESRREAGFQGPPKVYASLAITSGGYRRNEQLGIGSVIDANTDYGHAVREVFYDHGYDAGEVVVPSELGAMRDAMWGQLDYLMLWFHVMSNVSYDEAHHIENELMQQKSERGNRVYGMGKWEQNDKLAGLSPEEAWKCYEEFTQAYVGVLKSNSEALGVKRRTVEMVVGVLDNDLSLGGRAEKLWAELMEVPYYEMEVQTSRAPEKLHSHINALNELGARAIRLNDTNGPSMMFLPTQPAGESVKN